MMKRMCLAFAGLFSLLAAASVAQAAGTVPGFSLTPMFDLGGNVMPGCKLYVIQAGTTSTPQNAYQDTALSAALPNPITCDASGRLPQFFVADGLIKLRLTTATGTQVFVGDNLLVVGASSGGGSGGTIDATTIASTGDIKVTYGTSSLAGWVRANGRTIGSATSGATERANADTQSLFEYLWSTDANLTVSGGRGASASADWAANKTIALPDARGRVIAGLDDMGNSAAGRLSASFFGATATVLGAAGGTESHTLTIAQMPSHNHGGATGSMNRNSSHSHSGTAPVAVGSTLAQSNNFGSANVGPSALTINSTNTDHEHAISSQGGGSAHPNVQPTLLATIYIKL